jgi:hypothetical protein
MASNKDKAFALFYTAAATTVTAIIVVIATKQASKQPTNQAGIESIANLELLRLQLKEKQA